MSEVGESGEGIIGEWVCQEKAYALMLVLRIDKKVFDFRYLSNQFKELMRKIKIRNNI